MPKPERFTVETDASGWYWIKDNKRPRMDIADDQAVLIKSACKATTTCKALNEYYDRMPKPDLKLVFVR